MLHEAINGQVGGHHSWGDHGRSAYRDWKAGYVAPPSSSLAPLPFVTLCSRRFGGRVPGAFFGDVSRKLRDPSQKLAVLSCAGTRSKRAALPPVCPASWQGGSGRAPFSCLALSIYVRIYLYVLGPCRARGACAGVCHLCVCVFITAVTMKKLFAWGEVCVCVF